MFNNSSQTFLLQKVPFIRAATDRPLCECHVYQNCDSPVSVYLRNFYYKTMTSISTFLFSESMNLING